MAGIVRRRIFPFVLDATDQLVQSGESVLGENG